HASLPVLSQTATANFRDSAQLAGLTDFVSTKRPALRGPQVLFVLSTNETLTCSSSVQPRRRNVGCFWIGERSLDRHAFARRLGSEMPSPRYRRRNSRCRQGANNSNSSLCLVGLPRLNCDPC